MFYKNLRVPIYLCTTHLKSCFITTTTATPPHSPSTDTCKCLTLWDLARESTIIHTMHTTNRNKDMYTRVYSHIVQYNIFPWSFVLSKVHWQLHVHVPTTHTECNLLTLSMHAQEGYCSCRVCVCTCMSVILSFGCYICGFCMHSHFCTLHPQLGQ